LAIGSATRASTTTRVETAASRTELNRTKQTTPPSPRPLANSSTERVLCALCESQERERDKPPRRQVRQVKNLVWLIPTLLLLLLSNLNLSWRFWRLG